MAKNTGIAVALAALLFLAACAEQVRSHGFVPSDEDLEAVVVGRDTQVTVRTILGPPGATGLEAETGWYYVRSTYRDFAYQAPEEIDREVVAVSFDDRGVVENVERFGIDDGQVIALSRRVTDDNTRGVGFLRQLCGNLGRITADTLFR